MREMLLIGRGGQGVVLGSQILAEALAEAGYWVQSFPEFKAERRGAPISASLRWDEHAPVHRRYKVDECDALVVISAAPPSPELFARVRPGGLVLLNRETRFDQAGQFEIARVPALRIARRQGVFSSEGRPMANVAVLGACVKLLLPDGLQHLEAAISARFGANAVANIAAAREGYERCIRQRTLATDAPAAFDASPGSAPALHPRFPVSRIDSLVNHTGSWSDERPLLTSLCTACALCALFCPEGAIAKLDHSMVVDYLYCKGCGICEVVCPVRDAVHMQAVTA